WRGSSIRGIMASTSRAGQSRAIKVSRAVLASLEPRMSLITSSILLTAMASPTSTWARSRAFPSKYLVRRGNNPPPPGRDAGGEGGERALEIQDGRAAALEGD